MLTNQVISYEAFWDKLVTAYPISKGTMRLPIVTSLIELPGLDYSAITQELEHLLQSILDTHATKSAAISRATDAGESEIIPLIDSEYTGVVRFDCIWDEKTNDFKILEINCDYPDGLVLHDMTYGALDGKTCTLHQKKLKELFSQNEKIHVLYSRKAQFLDGYQAEYTNFLQEGKNTTIGNDTSEIPHGASVRRCLEVTKFSSKDITNLVNLSPRLINTIALRTLGYKDLLETIDHHFIPKTVRVTNDTLRYCQIERENLVLKPADGCEGYGIYFGKQMTNEDWITLVKESIQKNYIAQEFVKIPKLPVSLYENETITNKALFFDFCPHFFIKNGKVTGPGHTLMRFSENPVVNVTQGGGIGYYRL